MWQSVALVVLTFVITTNALEIYVSSCARMRTSVLDKAAHALCITSCKFQNCGTGSCEWRDGRGVCVCSRCADGAGPGLGLSFASHFSEF
uniref:INVERT_DEFENSINS domain-containing protein n=1 Tax=Ascaris lumbricoides TaxID=6252 RepID=A0A0M3HN19_ASCLU